LGERRLPTRPSTGRKGKKKELSVFHQGEGSARLAKMGGIEKREGCLGVGAARKYQSRAILTAAGGVRCRGGSSFVLMGRKKRHSA